VLYQDRELALGATGAEHHLSSLEKTPETTAQTWSFIPNQIHFYSLKKFLSSEILKA
jgi:hypothetical protein